jgi:predicted DCC family thiol-disulfide oxidoreductase YuxK
MGMELAIRRLRQRRHRTIFYDASCGICTQVMRVLANRDRHEQLTWISNQETGLLPDGVTSELLERTILVMDSGTGRRWTRSDAFYEIFAALPFGRILAWPLLVPGLRTIAGWAYDAVARNRTRISVFLGLAACEIPRRAVRGPLG